jgi:hypothetical protein
MATRRSAGRIAVSCGLALAGLTGCANYPQACGGQCTPPYQIAVGFKSGVSQQDARFLLAKCVNGNSVVISDRLSVSPGGTPGGVIYTKARQGPHASALMRCLHSAGASATLQMAG